MIASAAASSWTIAPKPMGAAVAPVRGPGPHAVNQHNAAAAPRLKLLSHSWQEASWAVRMSRCRKRVGIVIAASTATMRQLCRRSTGSQSRPRPNPRHTDGDAGDRPAGGDRHPGAGWGSTERARRLAHKLARVIMLPDSRGCAGSAGCTWNRLAVEVRPGPTWPLPTLMTLPRDRREQRRRGVG